MLQSLISMKQLGITSYAIVNTLKSSRTSFVKFSPSKNFHWLNLKTDYNSQQKSTILSTINKSSEHELEKFDISKQRLKKIVLRKEKQGEFASVEEIIELDGFGVKVLEKFCNSILAESSEKAGIEDVSSKEELNCQKEAKEKLPVKPVARKKTQFVSPQLMESERSSITTCVSFHVDLNFIAWTKFRLSSADSSSSSIVVEEWMIQEIGDDNKKISLSDLIQELIFVSKKIPQADVYVFESQISSPAAKQTSSPVQLSINVEKAQLFAMLSVLMASRDSSLGDTSGGRVDATHTPIFFLKNFIASRLYKTFVGKERVSAGHVIESIFTNGESFEEPKNAALSSIEIPSSLKEFHLKSNKVDREFMGQSMLIGLSFLKLCVLKCRDSIASLDKRN